MAKTPAEMAAVGKEFSHQTALFAWAAMARLYGPYIAAHDAAYQVAGWAKDQADHAGQLGRVRCEPMPQLKWLHAIKNQGHGDRIRGARSAAEGLKAGVFDTFLPWPVSTALNVVEYPRIYTGLYIELKTPDRINQKDGGASKEQLDFQADMRASGYAAEICHGWEAARDVLLKYLGRG